MLFKTVCDSPVGRLTLVCDGTALAGVWMEGQKYFAATLKEEAAAKDDLPVFSKTKAWLDLYFAGKNPAISSLPLAPSGSPFRQNVWGLLCEIPYGEVTPYGEIAKRLAKKTSLNRMSAQAVGGAVGHNPISIIIPCHRVVGSDGSLTGYAGGLDKKTWLLKHEGVDMSRLTVPTKGTAL